MKKEGVSLAYTGKRGKFLSTIMHIGGRKKKMKKESVFLAYREKRVSS